MGFSVKIYPERPPAALALYPHRVDVATIVIIPRGGVRHKDKIL